MHMHINFDVPLRISFSTPGTSLDKQLLITHTHTHTLQLHAATYR